MDGSTDHEQTNDHHALFHQLALVCDQAVMIVANDTVKFANDSAVGMLGAARSDQVVGQSLVRFGMTSAITTPAASGAPVATNQKIFRLDGGEVLTNVSLISCQFEGRPATLAVMRDVGERQRLEGRMQFLVRHDILTELPNRTEFRDRLAGAMARAKRNAQHVAIMLTNIDGFKAVNAKYGSEIGDLVLQEMARRLKACIRQADAVARLSGDEFGLILEAIDERQQAAVVANRVLANAKQPFDVGGHRIEIAVSIGLAAYPSDAYDLDALVRMADVAMYTAKEKGGGVFRLYFPEFEERSRRDHMRREQTAQRMATLTEREREVMDVLIEGNSSKAIAYLLGASPRTIENHRAKVMAKMQAESLPELVRMAFDLNKGGA